MLTKKKKLYILLDKNIRTLKSKAEVYLTRASNCSQKKVSDKVETLCGASRHLPSSEAYYLDACYNQLQLEELNNSQLKHRIQTLIVNQKGQTLNILPLDGDSKKSLEML